MSWVWHPAVFPFAAGLPAARGSLVRENGGWGGMGASSNSLLLCPRAFANERTGRSAAPAGDQGALTRQHGSYCILGRHGILLLSMAYEISGLFSQHVTYSFLDLGRLGGVPIINQGSNQFRQPYTGRMGYPSFGSTTRSSRFSPVTVLSQNPYLT